MTSDHPIVAYHNPRCSKSRRTLELLRERGVEPEVVLYLEQPPTAEEVKRLATQLDEPVAALVRTKETAWSEEASAQPGNDVTAPTPDPVGFDAPPAPLGESSITMTAPVKAEAAPN